jgi:hypothetical protein
MFFSSKLDSSLISSLTLLFSLFEGAWRRLTKGREAKDLSLISQVFRFLLGKSILMPERPK